MSRAEVLSEAWRGSFLETQHFGHAVVCDDTGAIVHAWGDPNAVILPRSSSKMIQALPLMTSGAAKKFGLTSEHLALACASHQGAEIHTSRVSAWLDNLDLGADDLRCGSQVPNDTEARHDLVRRDQEPCQIHNNCSGKHCGFLTLNVYLGGDAEYIRADHPVQIAALNALEEVAQETSPGFGIDGCSAPNYAISMHGMARAMAWYASAHARSDSMSQGGAKLVQAMMTHPDFVAGEGRACTELMRAGQGKLALKTGADGYFTAILPEKKMGVALKIMDGNTRAAESAISAILVSLGVLDAGDPVVQNRLSPVIKSRLGKEAGQITPKISLV